VNTSELYSCGTCTREQNAWNRTLSYWNIFAYWRTRGK